MGSSDRCALSSLCSLIGDPFDCFIPGLVWKVQASNGSFSASCGLSPDTACPAEKNRTVGPVLSAFLRCSSMYRLEHECFRLGRWRNGARIATSLNGSTPLQCNGDVMPCATKAAPVERSGNLTLDAIQWDELP